MSNSYGKQKESSRKWNSQLNFKGLQQIHATHSHKPLTNQSQTNHKPLTNHSQTKHKPLTNQSWIRTFTRKPVRTEHGKKSSCFICFKSLSQKEMNKNKENKENKPFLQFWWLHHNRISVVCWFRFQYNSSSLQRVFQNSLHSNFWLSIFFFQIEQKQSPLNQFFFFLFFPPSLDLFFLGLVRASRF